LTARNKESFIRLTPASRVAFIKRFVLLNEPGKASVTSNPAGRPTVRCETPDVTTEMQIGGAEIRDNLAFLPIELRDATDSTGDTVRRVTLGLVRESGDWKLLSLGVLFLDLPSLEIEWDQAEIAPNETAALEALKKIAEAIETYRKLYTRLPESLSNLGPSRARQASAQTADLLDSDLASGMKTDTPSVTSFSVAALWERRPGTNSRPRRSPTGAPARVPSFEMALVDCTPPTGKVPSATRRTR
jgi:hypothetical protein